MEHSGGQGLATSSSSSRSGSSRDQMLHSDGTQPPPPLLTMDDPHSSHNTNSSSLRKRAPPQGDEEVVSRERIAAVKKRILEHKHLRLKSVKERHAEHVAEWFYLQSGGNLMDYQVWRKKPQTQPDLINFMRAHRLEGQQQSGASSSQAMMMLDDGPNTNSMTNMVSSEVGVM